MTCYIVIHIVMQEVVKCPYVFLLGKHIYIYITLMCGLRSRNISVVVFLHIDIPAYLVHYCCMEFVFLHVSLSLHCVWFTAGYNYEKLINQKMMCVLC
jgi:hypothetical protein